MLEIQNLSCGYNGRSVLSQLALSVPEGSFTVILGPNGCGKSTLLKALAGILPFRGTVLLQGQKLSQLHPGQLAKQLAYLPQSRPVPEIPAEKLVLHGRFPYLGYPRRYLPRDIDAARNAMDQLGISHLAQRSVPTLSGGERQKVYLAMLLAQDTPLILMDEPTAGLDISHKFEVLQIAKQLTRQGKTVVAVLHELELAMAYADRIALMEGGCIRLCASPDEVFASGLLEQVFRIRAERIETPETPRYCFSPSL